MIPLLRRRISAAASIPAGDLDAILAAHTLSWRDDFEGTSLRADRWNILAEPGAGQSSPLGPVLEWPDHWGTYTHDPALVAIQDGVLRLGWGVTAGAWRAGGIVSASQYGGAPSAKMAATYGVTRARIRVPDTAGNSFGAVWQMPVANTYGAWPNSGEIDGIEWTQHPAAGNADRDTGFANVILAGGHNAGNTGALSTPAFDITDGQFHEFAWWRRPTAAGVAIDFFADGRLFHAVEITGAAADPLKEPFYFLLTAQLGWWGQGLPPDATLATQVFEIDWIEHWAPITVTPGTRPTDAPVLQAKGLSLVWQDRLSETDEPADSNNWFAPYMGSRNASTDFGVTDNRLSFATFDGRRCLREVYRANQPIYLNYRSQRLPTRYREFGSCADVFYPQTFNPIPQDSGRTSNSGKTVFGLLLGHPDFMRPGFRTDYGWAGSVCWPEDMWGSEAGVNWTSRNGTGQVEYDWYPHIVGAYVDGADKMRSTANTPSYLQPYDGAYSHPVAGQVVPPKQAIPKGRWFRLELYGRVDTNRRDGVLEMWIDGTLFAAWTGLDLGGWVGNRGLYKGRSQTPAPAGMAFTYTNTPYYSFGTGPLSNDCDPAFRTLGGFRFIGAFIRAMGGGYSLSTAHIPVSEHNAYFSNWRFYAKA